MHVSIAPLARFTNPPRKWSHVLAQEFKKHGGCVDPIPEVQVLNRSTCAAEQHVVDKPMRGTEYVNTESLQVVAV